MLEQRGYRIGSVGEFLGLSPGESRDIELTLVRGLRERDEHAPSARQKSRGRRRSPAPHSRKHPISPEWVKEIHRRCEEIDSGKATLLDGAMVINELREKYNK